MKCFFNGYKNYMKVSKNVQNAHKLALAARKNAHAPYSRFKVGAAIKIKGVAEPVVGANVENASFGATMCAERSALFSSIAAFGKVKPEFVVVVTAEQKGTFPCGLCLQVLAEFCTGSVDIYLGNEQEITQHKKFSELLPHAFRAFEV